MILTAPNDDDSDVDVNDNELVRLPLQPAPSQAIVLCPTDTDALPDVRPSITGRVSMRKVSNMDHRSGLSLAEKSLISTKTSCSWYIVTTFIIQHSLMGYAWWKWTLYHHSMIAYTFYWVLIATEFMLCLYYPFYADFILNIRVFTCNKHRKSLCLWKVCLALEINQMFYLIITNLIIPSFCIINRYALNDAHLWCPINTALLFSPSMFYLCVIAMISLSFALIAILVVCYMIYLDIKLYKIWQIECPANYSLYKSRATASSMHVIPHPELPSDDPYNLQMQASSSSDLDFQSE